MSCVNGLKKCVHNIDVTTSDIEFELDMVPQYGQYGQYEPYDGPDVTDRRDAAEVCCESHSTEGHSNNKLKQEAKFNVGGG